MIKNFSVITNALVKNDLGEILITQRSYQEENAPGKWTIPGGKIEIDEEATEKFFVVEETLDKEVKEETGIEVSDSKTLVFNNVFQRDNGELVLALVFLVELNSGTAEALDDTIAINWIGEAEINSYDFAPNVDLYLQAGFNSLNKDIFV